ncbi:hypothetical protein AB4304_06170 [Vibrio breoganii]|nr:hypothetical protein BCT05_02980 [Vibrio breoganii]
MHDNPLETLKDILQSSDEFEIEDRISEVDSDLLDFYKTEPLPALGAITSKQAVETGRLNDLVSYINAKLEGAYE